MRASIIINKHVSTLKNLELVKTKIKIIHKMNNLMRKYLKEYK